MALTTSLVVGGTLVGAAAANKAADTQAGAAIQSANIQAGSAAEAQAQQQEATRRAQTFFDPLEGIAQPGIAQAGFLTDPQAQFDFLQGNPLFELALQNANTQTNQSAASRGRLSAGDTLQSLSQNVLLAASPLIQQQKQSIGDLINLGSGLAGSQANIEIGQAANISDLITGGAAAQAAGVVGAGNAQAAGQQAIGGGLQGALLQGALLPGML